MPLAETCATLTGPLPELVRVRVADFVWPTVTFPKDSLAGLRVNCPSEVPVPDRSRFVTESAAVLEMAREPLKLPAALGANLTESVTL